MTESSPLDAGLTAFAEALKARGLRPLNPMSAPLADCRTMQARVAAVLNESSVPLAHERDVTVPRAGDADDAIPCRLYRPNDSDSGSGNASASASEHPPLLIYAHGGSFALGALDAWDGMLRELVRASGVAVLSVDYRLAPEHRFPAAFDDMLAVVRYAAREGAALGIDAARLAVGGDSAGANLALATALALRDAGHSPLSFLLLNYGVYTTDNTTPSWAALGSGAYGLSAAQMDWIWTTYLNAPTERADWRVAPLNGVMSGLPPAHLIVGDLDPLIDDSHALAKRLADANVPHTLRVYEGLTHGFIRAGPYSATVRRAVSDCAAALTRAFA